MEPGHEGIFDQILRIHLRFQGHETDFFLAQDGERCVRLKEPLILKPKLLQKKTKNQKHQSNQKGSKKEKNRDG